MSHRNEPLREGYRVFYEITSDDRGFEAAALALQKQISEAEKEYDITFLSGPSFRDDPGRAGGGVSFAGQGAVLKKKKVEIPKEKEAPIGYGKVKR